MPLRSARRFLLVLAAFAMLGAGPAAADSARFDAACDDPAGDVPPDYAGIDIVRISSRQVGDGVEVRVTMATTPLASGATHSLTVDVTGDGNPDLSYTDTGGGSFRGDPVYWDTMVQTDGNDLVYPIRGNGFDPATLEGSAWEVRAGAFAYGNTQGDQAVCAAASHGAPGFEVAGLALVPLVAFAARGRRR